MTTYRLTNQDTGATFTTDAESPEHAVENWAVAEPDTDMWPDAGITADEQNAEGEWVPCVI